MNNNLGLSENPATPKPKAQINYFIIIFPIKCHLWASSILRHIQLFHMVGSNTVCHSMFQYFILKKIYNSVQSYSQLPGGTNNNFPGDQGEHLRPLLHLLRLPALRLEPRAKQTKPRRCGDGPWWK